MRRAVGGSRGGISIRIFFDLSRETIRGAEEKLNRGLSQPTSLPSFLFFEEVRVKGHDIGLACPSLVHGLTRNFSRFQKNR